MFWLVWLVKRRIQLGLGSCYIGRGACVPTIIRGALISLLGEVTLAVDPLRDLSFGKSYIGLDSNIRNEPSLHVTLYRLDADLQQLLQLFGRQHFACLAEGGR